MKKPSVYGHRGAASEAPENTIPSFKLAEKLGVYGVEMDLHTSSDNKLIVMHDEALDRTTNGKGPVHSHTLDKIKKLDAGFKFGREWLGTKVPTLEEVFDNLGRVHYYLEIKQSYKVYPGIEEKVLDTVDRYGLKNSVQIISFDFDSLKRVREMDNNIKTGLLFVGKAEWFIGIAHELKVDFLQPSFNLIHKEDVKAAHENGFGIAAWTVDTAEGLSNSLRLGLDSVTSNNPRAIMRALKKYA